MNKKGFTLIELLAYLALLGIILTIGLHASRDMMVTSFIQFRRVSEREIFSSAEKYVIDNDLSGKIYVSVIKLVELGYGHTNELLEILSQREDFKESLDSLGHKKTGKKNSIYYDPKEIIA